MKKTIALFVLGLAFLVSNAQQGPKLPWGFGGLSVIDGTLRGSSDGFVMVGESVEGTLVRFVPDTTLGRIIRESTFVLRNPADDLLYFTVNQKEGSRLFSLQESKGKYRPVSVLPQGWDADILHPAFSPDGRCMVFSTSQTGGLGGCDLWCSRRNGDTWERPVNLGNRINTPGDELYPVFYGNYLLFASNGHGDTSLGYYSASFPVADSDDKVIFHPYSIQRLPEPINGAAADHELAIDTRRDVAYWISSRDGGDALYTFQGRLDGTLLEGQVLDGAGHPVKGADVKATVAGRTVAVSQTDLQGRYALYLQPGKDCLLSVNGKGYYRYVDTVVSSRHSQDSLFAEVHHDVRLTPLPVGQTLTFDNLFGPDADIELTDRGRNLLMFVVQPLRQDDALKARLVLTSRVGGDKTFNMMLNERRLSVLREYLEFNVSVGTRISFVNGNSEGVLLTGEKAGDQLKVIFLE